MELYKVSEFSNMTGLSKETLRYYAEIKLLEPVYVDPSNHYRYYDNGSYLVGRLLVYLRRFNFTIQEMLAVVNDESFENLEQLIKAKKRGLEAEIERIQTVIQEMDDFFEIRMEDEIDD
jgi:DNA-binding transcriptional MerR regulator